MKYRVELSFTFTISKPIFQHSCCVPIIICINLTFYDICHSVTCAMIYDIRDTLYIFLLYYLNIYTCDEYLYVSYWNSILRGIFMDISRLIPGGHWPAEAYIKWMGCHWLLCSYTMWCLLWCGILNKNTGLMDIYLNEFVQEFTLPIREFGAHNMCYEFTKHI